jgi:hypothetical protein
MLPNAVLLLPVLLKSATLPLLFRHYEYNLIRSLSRIKRASRHVPVIINLFD